MGEELAVSWANVWFQNGGSSPNCPLDQRFSSLGVWLKVLENEEVLE